MVPLNRHLGYKSLQLHSEESLDTKIFIEFVALIIRNKIYTCLKDAVLESDKKANYTNVPASIKELEKIEMIRLLDDVYRLDHAVTANQKAVLKAFGIKDATYVKKQAREISEQLASKAQKNSR